MSEALERQLYLQLWVFCRSFYVDIILTLYPPQLQPLSNFYRTDLAKFLTKVSHTFPTKKLTPFYKWLNQATSNYHSITQNRQNPLFLTEKSRVKFLSHYLLFHLPVFEII